MFSTKRLIVGLVLASSVILVRTASALPGVPAVCPLPGGADDPCAALQGIDCVGLDDELCRPAAVQIVAMQFVATTCDCIAPGTKCGPIDIITGGDEIRCPGDCPPPNPLGECFIHADGISLDRDFASVLDGDIPLGATLTCNCTDPPPDVCPLPSDPAIDPCAALQSSQCTEFDTATEHCFPTCVNFQNNGVTALECGCAEQDECHVQVLDGTVPTCVGGCPPGEECIETITDNPDLGGIDICCRCEPLEDGACCRDSDNDGIPDDCVQISAIECAAIGGTFHGVGTPCGGFGSCCIDIDGVPGFEACLEMDAICCEALLGQFTAGGMCLGDGNGNGIDDACDEFCPVPPAQNYCQELQLEDCLTDDPTEVCLPTCVRVIITEEIVLTFDKGQPGPITIPGVGTFTGDRVCLAGLNATEMPTQQTQILNFFKDTGDVVMTFQFVDTLVPIPPGPKDCGPDRICNGGDDCVFDGLPNIALGMADLSITPPPDCHLVVSNIGSSGKDGVRQDLPPGTTEMASGLATPNFSLSKPGTHADLRMIGDVQGGLISRMLIDNIAPGILQVVGDISPVGVTQYAVRIFNGGDSVVDATGLDQAVVTFPKDDIVVVDCKLVTIVQLVIEQCDCYDGSSCGPVQITPVGPNDPPGDFELSCNGDCPAGSECEVLINGVASGQNTVLASDVPDGAQVKCGCVDVSQFCDPEPLCQPLIDQCLSDDSTLTCRALCVQMVLDANGILVPEALLCDCIDPNDQSCGPVTVVPLPPPEEGFDLRCDGACEVSDATCQVLIDGVATGLPNINSSDVAVDSEVCCECVILPPPECDEPVGQTICADVQDKQCLSTDPNSQCLPLCVNIVTAAGPPEAVLCDCIDNNSDICGPVIITPINTPPSDYEFSCVGQCEAADEICEVFIDGNPTGQQTMLQSQIAIGSQVCCDCADDPPLPTCPEPVGEDICADLQLIDCQEPNDTDELCLPICVNFDPLTGVVTASECDCQEESDCHVIIDAAGQPICDGICADGTPCEPTTNVNADGTLEICCGCCPPNDLTVSLDTGVDDGTGALLPLFGNDDTWTVTGEPPPVGTLPRPATVIPTHPAWSLLPGTQWVAANATGPNGVYTYEKCFCLDERATNAQLDLLLLADDQAFVFLNSFFLGATPSPGFFNPPTPIFTNDQTLFLPGQINCVTVVVENQFGVVTGFDLAGSVTADDGVCCCGPTPDRKACQDVDCPNDTEECQARCIEFDPFTGQVTVLDCECREEGECHPTVEGGGDAHCVGGCPQGFDCIKDLFIDPVTGVQTLCCDCTPQLGACCFDVSDGPLVYETCQDGLSEMECQAAGGFFQGAGSVCTIEACCLPSGFCGDADPDCCLASMGQPQGAGTNCGNTECPQPDPGACCFDEDGDGINEMCLVFLESQCDALGGTFHGAGSTCTIAVACCFDADGDGIDERCQVMDELCCEDLGGTSHGPNAQCIGQGACCFGITGGSCVEIDGLCCEDLEAGTFLGIGSMCLGDTDGNGIDDRCECPADLNGDGTVGPFDLASLLASWGPCPACPADFNGDGNVGPFDLAMLLASWGPCP